MKYACVLCLAALLALAACDTAPLSVPEPEPEPKPEIEVPEGEPLVLSIRNDDGTDGFLVSCPSGVVCDEQFTYRAYTYDDDRVILRLSFDPQVVGNFTYDAFREHFTLLNLTIRWPERRTEKSIFHFAPRYPPRALDTPTVEGFVIELFGYDADTRRLSGKITGTIDRIDEFIEDRDDPDCITDDMVGLCSKSEPANISLVVTFDLTMDHDKVASPFSG